MLIFIADIPQQATHETNPSKTNDGIPKKKMKLDFEDVGREDVPEVTNTTHDEISTETIELVHEYVKDSAQTMKSDLLCEQIGAQATHMETLETKTHDGIKKIKPAHEDVKGRNEQMENNGEKGNETSNPVHMETLETSTVEKNKCRKQTHKEGQQSVDRGQIHSVKRKLIKKVNKIWIVDKFIPPEENSRSNVT
uniref:Uncharacterized protein n=2 Tax=Cacopsylla melanoneura TaxID=428564 RepID=A0A8D8QMG5_9HEMI